MFKGKSPGSSAISWTPPKALPETGIDLLLVYETAAELQLHARRLDRQHGEAVEPETQSPIDRRLDLLDFILTMPAKGLAGAQVKLRVLRDPRAGMAADDGRAARSGAQHDPRLSAIPGGL